MRWSGGIGLYETWGRVKESKTLTPTHLARPAPSARACSPPRGCRDLYMCTCVCVCGGGVTCTARVNRMEWERFVYVYT